MKYVKFSTFLITYFLTWGGLSSQKQYQSATIAFWNCENLFDIYKSDDVVNTKHPFTSPLYKVSMPEDQAKELVEQYKNSSDTVSYKMYLTYQILNDEFTPEGTKNFTQEKYNQKLNNLSDVIAHIGLNVSHNAPVVMGLVEVENRKVVEDLINQPDLAPYQYDLVHYNSFDSRGIDVALIYQKSRFIVVDSKRYIVTLPKNEEGYVEKTRDILRVSGLLDGEPFTFIVNHWPSRRGGEKASESKRAATAEVLKSIFDEVRAKNPNEKIIAMGDFNDDPVSKSIKNILKAKGDEKGLTPDAIYSPMEKMYKNGQGTLAYRDSWNLFDMLFLSANLVGKTNLNQYKLYKTEIFTYNGKLIAEEGQFKGYPRRSYGGDVFDKGGYSDHFPVYSVLIREKN